ncbi:MAG: CoA-transferase subunit beta [Rhodospirillales bacterium]|nr:CoA-transferase subunit beta [Rhodospirillales bacterium]
MTEPSRDEFMAVAAAAEIGDDETAFIGTGLPMVAAYLAKATHAPRTRLVFESGIIDPSPKQLATGVGDYRLAYGATKVAGMRFALGLLQRGRIDIAFLGTAEIDPYGNLNSTAIGGYPVPRVRLPGSGGANDMASMARRFVVICRQDPRRFVEKLNYVTSPGFLDGPGARARAGLPGGGPVRVITDLGVLGFDPATCRMRAEALFPGVDMATVQARTGFAIAAAPGLHEFPRPSEAQLRLLREHIDPDGIYVAGPR